MAAEQDWCLECGAPARTRLAPAPNWQLPTAGVAAIVLIAGALLAFAFVKLTGHDATTSSQTAPVVATQPAIPPAVATPAAPVTPATPAPPLTATAPSPPPTTTSPAAKPPQKPAAGSGGHAKAKTKAKGK